MALLCFTVAVSGFSLVLLLRSIVLAIDHVASLLDSIACTLLTISRDARR